eukprot:5153447-Amphidinium_carterae.1
MAKKGVLSTDGAAAIRKYCAEDSNPPLYKLMNQTCYDKDRTRVRPFIDFMWLLLKTLQELEPYTGIVYR